MRKDARMRFEYFAVPDDETAAQTIDGGEIDGSVGSHVVDPASVLGQLSGCWADPSATTACAVPSSSPRARTAPGS